MNHLPQQHWHHQPPAEVIGLLEANPQQGLDAAVVQARQSAFGPNALPPPKGRGPLLRFLLQFNQVLVYILLVATAIKLAVGAWTDAAVIFGVIFLNAVIGFIPVSYTHLRAHETPEHLVCRLLLEKKK